MIVFYHGADLDGKCSAAIWAKKYPNASLVSSNYHYETKLKNIRNGEAVVFLDFMVRSEEDLKLLYEKTDDVTIIDHHEFEDIDKIKFKGTIDPDSEFGACQMVWNYLYKDKPVPPLVKAISESDVWKRTYDNVRIQEALYTYNHHLKQKYFWKRVLGDDKQFYQQLLHEGNIIVNYQRKWFTRYVRAYSIMCRVKGLNALFVNIGMTNSSVFDGIDHSQYDILVRGTFSPSGNWKLSLTTDKEHVNVAEIAKEFDGGGRSNTAGCVVDKLEDILEFVDVPNRWDNLRTTNKNFVAVDRMRDTVGARTSYFSKYKGSDGISIAVGTPRWFTGDKYSDLFPSWKLVKQWKLNHDEEGYTRIYNEEVLDRLDPHEVLRDLEGRVLLCWEKSGEFCHRRIVAEWLERNTGVVIPEVQ